MSLIGRYIFRQIAFAFLLSLTVLIALMWLGQALGQVSLVMSQGQTLWLFLKVTLLAMPSLIVFIAPLALLIATIQTLNRLNNDSELVVVTAAGAPRRQIVAPVMFAAAIVMLVVGILSTLVQPHTARELRLVMTQVNADVIASFAQEGRFTQLRGITLHIRERRPDGTLVGLLLHDGRDPNAVTTFLAERGRILREDNGRALLLMENGSAHRDGGTAQTTNMIAFTRYAYDLSDFTQAGETLVLHPRERTTMELLFADTQEAYYQQRQGRFRAELHARFSEMLYPLAFAAIALATVGFARTSRQTRSRFVFIAIVWAIGLRLLGFASFNMTRSDIWAVFLVYALPLGALALALAIALGRTGGLTRVAQRELRRVPWARIASASGIDRVRAVLAPRMSAFLQRAGFRG